MSIERIVLYHFIVLQQPIPISSSVYFIRQAVIHYFLSDDIKQDAATTDSCSKYIVELLQNRQLIFSRSQYYLRKYGCFYGAINMCNCIMFTVNVGTGI